MDNKAIFKFALISSIIYFGLQYFTNDIEKTLFQQLISAFISFVFMFLFMYFYIKLKNKKNSKDKN